MTLNEPERARSAKAWFQGSLLLIAVSTFLPLMGVNEQAVRFLGLPYLLIWYFAAGRPQARYVKEKYGKDYPRQPWGRPVLISIALFVAYLVLVVVVMMALIVAGLATRG
jgi:hypothetical protein